MKKDDLELQRCGYLKCKIDLTEHLIKRSKELHAAMKTMRLKIENEQSLINKTRLINELSSLQGESRSLQSLTKHVASLNPDSDIFEPLV